MHFVNIINQCDIHYFPTRCNTNTFGEEYARKENPANGLLEFNGNGGGMFSYNQCKMHTKVGDLLIFPYDLRHGVYPFNSTTECRRTLSYNCDLTKIT